MTQDIIRAEPVRLPWAQTAHADPERGPQRPVPIVLTVAHAGAAMVADTTAVSPRARRS